MPRSTTDDHEDKPSTPLRDGAPDAPAKAHAPRLDQHGEAEPDSTTGPDKNPRRDKNPETSASDEGA